MTKSREEATPPKLKRLTTLVQSLSQCITRALVQAADRGIRFLIFRPPITTRIGSGKSYNTCGAVHHSRLAARAVWPSA